MTGMRAVLAPVLVAAACAVAVPVPVSAAVTATSAAPDLAGRSFGVKAWRVGGVPRPVAQKAKAGITFAGNGKNLSAYFGCNQISGTYTIFMGRLRTPGLAMTKMYCVDTAEQEQALVALLQSRPAVRLVGDRLVLKVPGTRLVLTER